ncbi:MAG: chloride channel protein [Dehalococcoidia bacterium]|nr:chloride channel protein [Dehalococcoidia bacterium]MCB9484800.1 chloride channel protein [Thermoflexaceae bacterium]
MTLATATGAHGDFTATPRIFLLAGLAAALGIAAAGLAWTLLRLIQFFTNLFWFHRISVAAVSPAESSLGWPTLIIPVVGGLIVGLMARYGSDKIRGHGIPEAIEAILINRSRVQPRVSVLKPLSSAISIGSGGPFGAEGPIIMTGGAVGSLVASLFQFTSAERKTILVAGAAGGMSATFGTPVAAVLLAVELLLYEWKPRSLVPVGAASATAALTRHYIIGEGALFAVPAHHQFVGPAGLAGCLVVGLTVGVASLILTNAVYASEDGFHRLPIHWMWWPAIGGAVIGVGGMIAPETLGVGYDVIGRLLDGSASNELVLSVIFVKSTIWAVSLGSGTSGGVLAPLLMVGAAIGALEANILPAEGPGFWSLIAIAAILGGTLRSPLTGVIFALEITRDVTSLLPLLVAAFCAYALTVVIMKRSILTEKVARRGYHLHSEYGLDPLELVLAHQVMLTAPLVLPAGLTVGSATAEASLAASWQRLFPALDASGALGGVVSRSQLELANLDDPGVPLAGLLQTEPVVAYADEPLRAVAFRMSETGYTSVPVVSRDASRTVIGILTPRQLLEARRIVASEERVREGALHFRRPVSRSLANGTTPTAG